MLHSGYAITNEFLLWICNNEYCSWSRAYSCSIRATMHDQLAELQLRQPNWGWNNPPIFAVWYFHGDAVSLTACRWFFSMASFLQVLGWYSSLMDKPFRMQMMMILFLSHAAFFALEFAGAFLATLFWVSSFIIVTLSHTYLGNAWSDYCSIYDHIILHAFPLVLTKLQL